MLKWISEGDRLPPVGQIVLYARPRQASEFWDFDMAQMLIRHEGVSPLPVKAGEGRWPTDYFWGLRGSTRETFLVTGNGWWAMLDGLPLPPGARHKHARGYHVVEQIGQVFVPKHRNGT